PSLQVATTDAILPCDDLETSIEVQLLSGLDVSYTWDDGSTEASLQVFEPGIYQVEVANACETTTASISVNRGTPDLSDYFYIPNAFSPNSDGINDRFMAYAASEVQVESYTLDIFDRWGNQVYHSDDINEGWTGVYRSKMMSIGVYIWQVQATVNSCGEQVQIERGGDVALLK
ncbi:MAG: gliding motility-associated C-terminal domain-containing protein, partial [Bacteroidota bacterium]